MTARLIQLSGVVIDLVYSIPSLPAPGDEVESLTFETAAGGGFNAAAAARRLGADVVYAGALGTGAFAEIAAQALAAEAIALADEARVPLDQGHCIALVDERAERTFVSYHGAERHVTPAQLAKLHVGDLDWLLLSGYSLYKTRSAAVFLRWLRTLRRGPRFLFDPGPVAGSLDAHALGMAMKRADWISVNAKEADVLMGKRDPAAAAAMLAQGRLGAIVRTGADGCWLATDGQAPRHVPGFQVQACDSNGAGDAHDGAFIAGAMHGLDPYRCAVLANAAAAISTTLPGPARAPNLETVKAFLAARDLRWPDDLL